MKEILSLGAGVQSSTILLMALAGELPLPDVCIFADTGWEPAGVYAYLDFLSDAARAKGLPIHRVTAGNIKTDILLSQVRGTKAAGSRWASMPLHTLSPAGKKGMIRRQCTGEYKIRPLDKAQRAFAGLSPHQKVSAPVVRTWIGISTDEAGRMRESSNKWQVNYYPLIDLGMSRKDCLAWLTANNYPLPAKSSCIGCPFHSNEEWKRMTAEDFADACEVDDQIRNMGGMRGQVFLHRSCVPLREVDFRSAEDMGQRNWINECMGMCGV